MCSIKSLLLLCVALLLIKCESGSAERLVKISSKFLEVFADGKSEISISEDEADLTENLSSFLASVHSRGSNDDLLLRAVEQYAAGSNQSEAEIKCLQDITTWTTDKQHFQMYALQMQDSWASRQGGMLEGNVRWTGHYWECVNAISNAGNFKGKFCTTYYGFTYVPNAAGIPVDIMFDSCYPSSCSDEIIQNLTGLATASDIRVPVLETTCTPAQDTLSFDGFDITIIVISSILLLLACIGTGHDIRARLLNTECKQWMLCFSVLKNGEKIISTKQSPNTISAINGIRVFSTLWVILGHTLLLVAPQVDNVVVLGKDVRERIEFMVITNGTFSVDTFFIIGGLLTSYLTLKQLKKTKGKMNVPLMYLHRYLRLTPLYAYVLLFTLGLYKFLGSGPRWLSLFENVDQNCDGAWWTNLLYFNNLYPTTNYCFGHSWYLACDMQFYIIAPLFIYGLYKCPHVGVLITTLVTLGSIGVTWWLSEWSELQPMAVSNAVFYTILSRFIGAIAFPESQSYSDRFKTDLYFTPWCRICVYLLGILAGYLLHKTERKIKLHKVVVFLGWLLSVGTGVSIVYGLFAATKEPKLLDVHVSAFYLAVSRPLWGACVAWVIIACTCGYGGPVTRFLNWSFFLPLSRLTYAVYLIHFYVLYWYINQQVQYTHYSAVWLTYAFSGHVIITVCLAFLAAVLIEWPCQEILKVLLPSGKPPPTSTTKPERISLEKPPSYRSEDQNYVLDEINKTPIEDQHENESIQSRSGDDNLAFDKNETYATKI